jgi:D-alanyl-lipoteichoic acid acyltransferase DltB (MBOAT superfamily)
VLFNTLAYARFFAVVFVAAWLLARFRRTRVVFLLLASYVFYAHWDYRFVPLIWISSTADWLLGNAIGRATTQTSRKRWLVLTVILNLGLLGFFKYFNFGIDSARMALEALGYHPPPLALEVALPVGISFFTFESMSYVIDVYRREIEPHPSYLEYLTFVAFFPHLVAGPIVRPRDLLPQLAAPARFVPEAGSEALFLIAVGLLKKVAIGDYLALNLVDRVFDAPARYSALECYAAVIGYSLQIYCDFSGYTDIAIGSALLLGVRFPPNFAAPYTAVDLIDFWRRWHISLSTWLRDYLYVPLGGNRAGSARTYANLLITMLLGGLWHGASWTFVLWGGAHGLGLAFNRYLRDRFGFDPARYGRVARALSVVATFHFVAAAWILFRAQSFDAARAFFARLATLTSYHPNLDWRVLCVMALGLLGHFMPRGWYARQKAWFMGLPAPAQAVFLFGALLVLRSMAQAETVPFVYFQF